MSSAHALTALLLASGGIERTVRCDDPRIGVVQASRESRLAAAKHTVVPRPAPQLA